MAFSHNNPGFALDVSNQVDIHQPDVPMTSSGSSAASSGDSTRHSCSRCHGRMTSFSRDRHLFCDHSSRCDECLSWTKEEMDSYVKSRKSMSSKSKNKGKPSLKTTSSPPWSTAPDSDIGARFSAQLITVNKSIDDKISAMSSTLMLQFSDMLDKFRVGLSNPSFSVDPKVLGQSVSHTESPSLRHPVSTEYQRLQFQGGGVDPVPSGSGLAQSTGGDLDRAVLGADAAHSRDLPSEDYGNAQHPPAPARPRVAFAHPIESISAHDPEDDDDDDDDRDSIAEPSIVDKTLARLFNFVYDKLVESRPLSDPSVPPRCVFEDYFAVSKPPSSARQRLRVYPRVNEILDVSTKKASRLVRESKPLHKVVPLRRKIFQVADALDFVAARFVNPDFSRISNSKNIQKSRSSSVSFADLEKIERAGRTVIAGYSQCFWLLSSLLAQLKDGFCASDPALFDKNISALSAALASQTAVAAGLTDFVTSKRRQSYLAHASCPIAESQKRELLVAPGTDSLLFNQLLLEKVVSQLKEDSLIASSVSLSNLSKAAGRARSTLSGGDRYSSPLEQPRPGPSGFCKRSASPARGSFSKRVRRGRGMSPSSNRGKGFRK